MDVRRAGPQSTSTGPGAHRQGGRASENGCGTGHKLIPIASDGHPCAGLDFSSDTPAQGSAW